MHTSLGPGAQKLFRHKWKKLNTASFHFGCVGEKSCIVCWNEFFPLCFKFQVEVFSYCTFSETFAIGFQKWFDHKWIDFGVFRCNMAFFVDFISACAEICMNGSSVLFVWRDQMFSVISLKGILLCSLKLLMVFNHKVLKYRLLSFNNAMQLVFLSFCVFQSLCFLGSIGKTLWLLLKTK